MLCLQGPGLMFPPWKRSIYFLRGEEGGRAGVGEEVGGCNLVSVDLCFPR